MKSKTLALILLCCAASLGAKVKLPALVGDNMILQQQTEVKLWGNGCTESRSTRHAFVERTNLHLPCR